MTQPSGLWLVVGAGGMLGRDLTEALRNEGITFETVVSGQMNITEPAEVAQTLRRFRPSVVINTAALTDVDGCESMGERAFAVNAHGPENLARACRETAAFLVHVSTDYVFDGSKKIPYTEEDPPSPLGVYGRSKEEGERLVRKALPDAHCIVRTQWLFGPHGKNFVEAILGRTERTNRLRVVNDQYGAPTYTSDLAVALVTLSHKRATGTFHVTNSGVTSWHGFACRIIELGGVRGVTVEAITSMELARPAPRPSYSVLDNRKFVQCAGYSLRHWEDALQDYLGRRGAGREAWA
ncbi:MAG: dTDP-4-dehydrorhamnose reductase [Desulfomonile sp.]|nr:dTDP-4-dehydrorhamnose reductase [Desulfomonile sp.]